MTTDQQLVQRVAFTPCQHCGDSNWPGHCPYVQGQCTCGGIDCGSCQGTGLCYSDLSVVCECVRIWGEPRKEREASDYDKSFGVNKYEACDNCQGRGRIARSPEDPATLFFLFQAICQAVNDPWIQFEYWADPPVVEVTQGDRSERFWEAELEPGKETEALFKILDQIREGKR